MEYFQIARAIFEGEIMMEVGSIKGERCARKFCSGIIDEHERERGCSCHINPPCSSCTEDRHYCPECDWAARDERTEYMNGFEIKADKNTGEWITWKRRELDPSKIDYHVLSHTHFSQICEGVYPDGTTSQQVLEKVKGTFGGRFEYFGDGKFKYIAYTD